MPVEFFGMHQRAVSLGDDKEAYTFRKNSRIDSENVWYSCFDKNARKPYFILCILYSQ